MSVQTECRTWKLVFESYAEVQPDFAIAKIQHVHPEIQIFEPLDIAPPKLSTPQNGRSGLYLSAFRCIFHTLKKVESGYVFYLLGFIQAKHYSNFIVVLDCKVLNNED